MRYRSLLTALFAALLLLIGSPLSAQAQPGTDQSLCRPGTPDAAPPTTDFYDEQRPYLGPDPLPRRPPVGALLFGYQRFGRLTADEFVAKYRNESGWIYPPADGFVVIAGRPWRHAIALRPGQRIDRFGYPGGRFLAPVGDRFAARALPPQNLNTPQGASQSNYHLYCVLRQFDVDAGPIAPWFEQPGGGTQFVLMPAYLPEAGAALSVTWLLRNGYLVEERP
ncbi:TNT domain-containing protein [Nocardia sp. CDC159]|uniref:TNT domain-containing protein n=1 Tax=Nocardia pulmonis TaxID=2951408 RepID=A0A9X2E3P2_9NOCA|nr:MULTISPECIES: TNT domain-containing protein [Nocardia]MCM6773697.1 TNT domain-containing protein [Nocardia pulmonis]MCM6786584.1 TNT domain-containing protein [Nocardia sp. CDC159]